MQINVRYTLRDLQELIRQMTNTRIGDVEIAETRFPLLLREFSIRRGTGGKGVHHGGDGVHREYEARVPMEVRFDGFTPFCN